MRQVLTKALLTTAGAVDGLSAELLRSRTRTLPDDGTLNGDAEVRNRVLRAEHMQYADLLRNDIFIGSGCVEAVVKRLITLRMERSGATWSGVAIIDLRGVRLSDSWNQDQELPIQSLDDLTERIRVIVPGSYSECPHRSNRCNGLDTNKSLG